MSDDRPIRLSIDQRSEEARVARAEALRLVAAMLGAAEADSFGPYETELQVVVNNRLARLEDGDDIGAIEELVPLVHGIAMIAAAAIYRQTYAEGASDADVRERALETLLDVERRLDDVLMSGS